ncbi:MAG TPA: hypothetical protein IAA24_07915 [Candidatus Eubacterium faecigallinarum]|nr:hypothetical protein [Candidatus Eubacterium faecigallinarum]
MQTTESLGYLKGLLDGLDLDDNKKETKVFKAIVDVLSNLAEDVDDITDGMELLAEQIDAVDEDLADVEDYLADDECDDCCDCCDCDDDYQEFEVECPCCGEEIVVDEDTVLNGSIPCPNCGEMLEFEVECEDEEDDAQE